jgi:hypothetical protein
VNAVFPAVLPKPVSAGEAVKFSGIGEDFRDLPDLFREDQTANRNPAVQPSESGATQTTSAFAPGGMNLVNVLSSSG